MVEKSKDKLILNSMDIDETIIVGEPEAFEMQSQTDI